MFEWTGPKITHLLFISASLFLLACSHGLMTKKVEGELKQQPEIGTVDLNEKAIDVINESPQLTANQKGRLLDLQKRTNSQVEDLRDQSFKLRALLIEDMTKPDFTIDAINVVKDKLKTVEQKRLNVVFNAIDEANAIIGRRDPQNYRILHSMYPDEFRGREKN